MSEASAVIHDTTISDVLSDLARCLQHAIRGWTSLNAISSILIHTSQDYRLVAHVIALRKAGDLAPGTMMEVAGHPKIMRPKLNDKGYFALGLLQLCQTFPLRL